jgi:phage baseplate assembly protein W
MASGIGIKLETTVITVETIGVIKTDAELVAEAIHRILNTAPYERPRESVGCEIKQIQFEPNDFLTSTLGAYYINDAITKFEPRAVIESITALPDTTGNKIVIEVIFRFQNDRQLFSTSTSVSV